MGAVVRSAALIKYSGIAQALGIDAGKMVSKVGADRACLYSPDLRIPEQWLADVFEGSAQAAGCPDLGLRVAEGWHLSDFGPVSLLLQHQPTLRHALAVVESYRHLLSNSVAMEVEEQGELALVHVRMMTGRPDPGRQAVELAVGVVLSLMRAMLGPGWKPRHVHLSHRAPPSHVTHKRVLGPGVVFDGDFNGIVLDRADLDRVNPRADANLASYAKVFLDAQDRLDKDSVSAGARRAILLLLPGGGGNVKQVGLQLGLSPRTLQRRLAQEGQEFSSLLNDVRAAEVARYLEDQRYPVTQIAMLLGFSDVSTFSRWFSTQFGMTPTQWRSAGDDRPGG